MSFPRAMPGRSPEKSIMINLGNKLRLRLDTSRSSKRVSRVLGGHLTPQRLIFGKDTDRTQVKRTQHGAGHDSSRSSEKRLHELNHSPQPRLATQGDQSRTIRVGLLDTVKVGFRYSDIDETELASRRKSRLELSRRNIQITLKPTRRTATGLLTEMITDLLNSRKGHPQVANERVIKRVVNQRTASHGRPLDSDDLREIEQQWFQIVLRRQYYEGEVMGETREGNGTLTFVSGQRLSGYFVRNLPNGNCTFYRKDGSVIIGVWKAGVLQYRIA